MDDKFQEEIAQRLAAIRNIILDREGEDVQDQFVVGKFTFTVNIEGSGYGDPENEETQEIFTLIQVEHGATGMEELLACAVEQYEIENPEENDSFLICNEELDAEALLDTLDNAIDEAYRHWHWLDNSRDVLGALHAHEEDDDDDL